MMPGPPNPLMQGPMALPSNRPDNPLMGAVQNQSAPMPLSPKKIAVALEHNKNVGNKLAQLFGDPDVSNKDVLAGISDLLRDGSITPQQAAVEASQAPQDPQQLKAFLKMHLMQNMELGRQLHMMAQANPLVTAMSPGAQTPANPMQSIPMPPGAPTGA
jgi:hypothetical protein